MCFEILTMIAMQKRKVIKGDISIGTFGEFVNSLIDLSKNNGSSYVCVCNVHMLIEANDSNDFSKVVNEADIVTPDGKPVAKAVEWLYGIEQPRVAGMDLIESLFRNVAHLTRSSSCLTALSVIRTRSNPTKLKGFTSTLSTTNTLIRLRVARIKFSSN